MKFCFVTILALLLFHSVICQTLCTTEPTNGSFGTQNTSFFVSDDEIITIRLSFHVIANDEGIGGISQEEIETSIIPSLDEFYEPLNINFCLFDYSQVNSTYWYDQNNPNSSSFISDIPMLSPWSEKLSPYSIDCFVVNKQEIPTGANYAQQIGGGKAEVQQSYLWCGVGPYVDPEANIIVNSTLAHEIGHCLGLEHPHNSILESNLLNEPNCIELVNGDENNRALCGDKVFDTPAYPHATPNLIGNTYNEELGQCEHILCSDGGLCFDENGDAYELRIDNLMWFHQINRFCGPHLTAGQGMRIRNNINEYQLIANYLVPNNPEQEYVELSLTKSQTFLNETLYLSSLKIENGTATFENCELVMSNDAEIEISPNGQLFLNSCSIKYTNRMRNTIVLERNKDDKTC